MSGHVNGMKYKQVKKNRDILQYSITVFCYRLRSHKECTEHKTSTDPVNHESADIEDKYDPVNYESADIEDKSDPVNYESADIEDKSEGAIYENADGNEKISLASNEAYGISQVKRQ